MGAVMMPDAARRPMAALLPIMAVVLTAFLVIGLALPVLPLHVLLAAPPLSVAVLLLGVACSAPRKA